MKKARYVGERSWVSFYGFFLMTAILVLLLAAIQANLISYGFYLTVSITAYFVLLLIFHDCSHESAHPNRQVNRVLGWIIAAMTALPFNLVKSAHLKHHRFANTEQDPDQVLYRDTLKSFVLIFLTNFVYYSELRFLSKKEQLKVALFWALWIIPWFFFPRELLLFWAVPALAAVALFSFLFIYASHHPYLSDKVAWFGPFLRVHHSHHGRSFLTIWEHL